MSEQLLNGLPVLNLDKHRNKSSGGYLHSKKNKENGVEIMVIVTKKCNMNLLFFTIIICI